MGAPETIVCVECGGTSYRLTYPPHEGDEPGDVVGYRCRDCLERWDVVLTDEDFEEPDPNPE